MCVQNLYAVQSVSQFKFKKLILETTLDLANLKLLSQAANGEWLLLQCVLFTIKKAKLLTNLICLHVIIKKDSIYF